MTEEEFRKLDTGDIVRHVSDSDAVVVHANYGKRVTAVRTYDLTNPSEWLLIHKANYSPAEKRT